MTLFFLYDNVPINVEPSMVKLCWRLKDVKNRLKVQINFSDDLYIFFKNQASVFVSSVIKNFFTRFSIPSAFLYTDFLTWKNEVGYKSGKKKLQTISVVPDIKISNLFKTIITFLQKMKLRKNLYCKKIPNCN